MENSVNETSIFYQNIWCVYPLSGTYTRLQRIIFYLTIVIAFFFRSQQWVSSIAMGSVFVYSVVAAVHSIPLSVQQSLGADADIVAVFSIVLTSLYCAVMARMYSPRFIGRDFNDFYNWWMIGLVLPAVLASIGFVRFTNSTPDYVLQLGCPDLSDCPDPCDSQLPDVLFRGSWFENTMGVVLDSWFETTTDDGGAQTSILGPPVDDRHINGYRAAPTITEGFEIAALYIFFILGQRNQYRPPRSTRNKVFRRLRLKRVMSAPIDTALTPVVFHMMYYAYLFWRSLIFFIPMALWLRRGFKRVGLTWSLQKWIEDRSELEEVNTRSRDDYARDVALSWYILCMIGYVGIPIALVLVVLELELVFFNGIPESEGLQAVGQWGPAVGLGVTFLLAIILRWLFPEHDFHRYLELEKREHDVFSYDTDQREQGWYWKYPILAFPIQELRDLRAWYRSPTLTSQENKINEPTQQSTPTTRVHEETSGKDIELFPICEVSFIAAPSSE
ncbi:hypothetical protein GGR51DRAFT_562255 [Nemania sp. FL0031]|nr:hypothetical protein GGR51DRAFT_562255 [Nemania sp. FL0031]